ncbi:MAG: sigma-70 family RNA polymerase sigma factor [Clostridia bacterium]|nr:sigma-70 family RNA polymerase sigma factor [Clostridia bacterium]
MTDGKEQLNNLIFAVAQGQTQCLDGIFEIAARRMNVAALAVVGDRAAAEDVVSDSFIKIVRFAGKYRRQDDPMAWILRIVRNTALDYLRKRKRRAEVSSECLFDLCDPSSSPEKIEAAATLELAISKLAPDERRAIYMRYYLDMTVREIAEAIRLTRSSAERLIQRAETNLKTFLKNGKNDN